MDIQDKVKDFIRSLQLLDKGEQVLVGFSGGSDSTVLLHLLNSLGFRCVAAHCNFHLRGHESDRDESFAKKFCETNNIAIHVQHLDTKGYAQEHKISIEMAARELRYTWFKNLSKELHIKRTAIAHHQDDSNETVLLNLIRGTGIRGLTGIAPIHENIIRPLLCLTKKEVNAYIAIHQLPFVEDSSNDETLYQRNKIRQNILPLMEEINPSARDSIAKTAKHLQQVDKIYKEYVAKARQSFLKDNFISIPALELFLEPETLLFETILPYGFNSAQAEQIYASRYGESGRVFYSSTYRIIKDRDTFIITPCQEEDSGLRILIQKDEKIINTPIQLKIEYLLNTNALEITTGGNTFYADASKISFPLTLRKWKQGDWFIPFGMKGRKKVSDFFSDNKFSLSEKEKCWILESEGQITWLVGHRSDNRFRIEKQTKEILKITFSEST